MLCYGDNLLDRFNQASNCCYKYSQSVYKFYKLVHMYLLSVSYIQFNFC